jgi:L-malate glycosyltransferase
MKVAIVYDLAYPYHLGGAERRLWELARRLAARGHTVELLSMQMWPGPPVLVQEGVRSVGVCAGMPPFNKRGNRSLIEPVVFACHLFRYLRRTDFDLIDCAEMPYLAALAARLAILGRRTKLVVTWHEARGLRGWVRYNGWTGLIAAMFERICCRLTRHNIAISEMTARRAREILGIRNMAVVPCGVDLAVWQSWMNVVRGNQILYVGRLVRHKHVDWVIDAFAELDQSHPGFKLKIIGAGYAKTALVDQVARLGLQDKVVFEERVSEQTLAEEYARSRALLFPSTQEGFGMVIIEAMAAGTPVVALDAPDSAAATIVANGQDGMLVQTQTEMVEALKRLASDEDLWQRLSSGGRATVRSYDWTPIVETLDRFYRSVTA